MILCKVPDNLHTRRMQSSFTISQTTAYNFQLLIEEKIDEWRGCAAIAMSVVCLYVTSNRAEMSFSILKMTVYIFFIIKLIDY